MSNLQLHKKLYSLETEKSVLGSMMLASSSIPKAITIIDEHCFYDMKNRDVYKAIINLHERNIEADIITVSEELKRRGKLEYVGGTFYIAEINIASPTASNIEQHCYILLELFIKRSLIDLGSEMVERASDPTTDALDEIDIAETRIFMIAEKRLRKSFQSAEELSIKVFRQLIDMINQDITISGVPTGFTGLDNKLSGFQKSDFIIIAARPSMGKTAFALSCVRNVALLYKTPIAIFSLEMSGTQLIQRLIASQSNTNLEKFRNGKVENDIPKILDAMNAISEATILIDDSPSLTVLELRAKSRRLKAEHNIQIIFIDYLQLLSSGGVKSESREREISHISRSLKQLAKELDIPIIALSQLNRSVESRADKIPLLSDLRESGSLEQDADVVLFINRREVYGITEYEDTFPTEGTAEIIIAKQRSGSIGEVRLAFLKEFARFENLSTATELPVHKIPTLQEIDAF